MIGAYTDVPDTLSGLFNKSKSSKAFEEWTGMTTVGIAEEKPEGTGVVYKDPTVRPVKRLVHVTYGLGIRATREAIDDEQHGQLKKLARLVGRSFAIRKQVEMATLFNDASTGTYFTGYDAKPLLDGSHPMTGLTWDPTPTATIGTRATATANNELATPADLDYVSLQDMITLMRRQVDEQGDWVSFTPTRLVIAPENEFVAYEILKSTLRPDSANNATSSVKPFQPDGRDEPLLRGYGCVVPDGGIVLFHDVEKIHINGERDHTHAFRSTITVAKALKGIGFVTTNQYTDVFESWQDPTLSTITDSATKPAEIISDNSKLPEIIKGVEKMYGRNTPATLIVKGVLLHMSINVVKDWPQSAPLSDNEIVRYVDSDLLPLLKVMHLADNEGWSMFEPETGAIQRSETLEAFERIEEMIRKQETISSSNTGGI